MERLFWVCLAGAVGTGTRYLVAVWAAQRLGSAFPYGTLFVNLAGCFLIALILQSATIVAWPPTLRTALTVGFLGGLTTYSSFNYESTRFMQEGVPEIAAVNVALTVFGCFVAGWLGILTARQLVG